MHSSQVMRRMDKYPLVLEKEDIQANIPLPSSVDQVMQHSQNIEKGSSNRGKVKRVLGTNKCKKVPSLKIGEKVKLTFYNNRTVEKNGKLFLRHLEKIIRDRNICPLGVSSWSDISQEKLNHIWAAIEDKFDGVELSDHREHILRWMNELWNKWRGYLYEKYVKNKSLQQALKYKPYGIDKKEWEWSVKEHFASEAFQAQIEEMVNAEPFLSSIEIVGKCFGPQNRSHVVFFGDGVKAKDLKGGTSSKAELLSMLHSTQEENKYLNKENKSLNDYLSTLEDEIKK
ncbi:hypothetical protein P3L10_032795 [Capsicum annuum]